MFNLKRIGFFTTSAIVAASLAIATSETAIHATSNDDLTFDLLKDINTSGTPSEMYLIGSIGSTLYLTADDGTHGQELWKSDGTPTGTSLVKDIDDGPSGSQPGPALAFGGMLYFHAFDTEHGYELWKSDGTPEGTTLVKDITPGRTTTGPIDSANSSFPENFFVLANNLYFTANDGVHGKELWKSDGTPGGTTLVKDILLGANSSFLRDFVVAGNFVYFVADDETHGYELWKSDGTPGGTTLVKDIHTSSNSFPSNLFESEGLLYFAADDGTRGRELWRSDGTPDGTTLVKDINTTTKPFFGFNRPGSSSPSGMFKLGSEVFFSANDSTHGAELWKSDGTPEGTTLVKDINLGGPESSPSQFKMFNGQLYFSADDGSQGVELWKTNGTPEGTTLVKDISPGTNSSEPSQLTILGNNLFLQANDNIHGVEIWKSDGTPEGTTLVKDINPGLGSALDLAGIKAVGNNLYFKAEDGAHGNELWKSDGTPGGTTLVKDINSSNIGSAVGGAVVLGDNFYFTSDDGAHGNELWKSDGTPGGTSLVKDIQPGVSSGIPGDQTNLVIFNDFIYFVANDGSSGFEIWKSNGTPEGTTLVKDINLGVGGSSPSVPVVAGDALYFSAYDSTNGNELWKSDGTPEGTTLVKNVNNTSSGSLNYGPLSAIGSTLYFAADDGTHGNELWKSDGTPEGTTLVKDINLGIDGSSPGGLDPPRYFLTVGDKFYFTADDGSHGYELWKSDGTPEGTTLVKDIRTGSLGSSVSQITHLNDSLYFSADDGTHGYELWKSDGTPQGTSLVIDINPGSDGSSSQDFTVVGDYIFFISDDGTHGSELWKSDGTPEGTTLLKDINTSSFSVYYETLTSIGNTLYFAADDGTHGTELWKSDGTESGTVLVDDIRTGEIGSTPQQIFGFKNKILLVADDGAHGNELLVASQPTYHKLNVPYVWDSASSTGPIGTIDGSGFEAEIQLSGQGGIPYTNVAAVEMNVEVNPISNSAYGGYATIHPCGNRPNASNLTWSNIAPIRTSLVSLVSVSGRVCVYVYGRANVKLTVTGYFDTSANLDLYSPTRLINLIGMSKLQPDVSREISDSGLSTLTSRPASTYVNIFTLEADQSGVLTASDCSTNATATSFSFLKDDTVNAFVRVPLSTDGTFCIKSTASTRVIIDRYFVEPEDSGFSSIDSPASLQVAAESGGVRATWTPPTRRADSITGYALWVSGIQICSVAANVSTCLASNSALSQLPATSNRPIYEVRAIDHGSYGTPVYALGPVSPPSSPLSLSAIAGNQSVSVSFTAPSSNGGTPVTNYKYQINDGPWQTRNPVSTTSPLVISGLTNGVSVSIKLRAVTSAGDGTESSSVTATPMTVPTVTPLTVPGAPRNLSAVVRNGAATVAFSAPVSNGGATISEYIVTATPPSGAPLICRTASTSCEFTNLVNNVEYDVQVYATNQAGSGASSSSISIFPAAPPSANALNALPETLILTDTSFTPGERLVLTYSGFTPFEWVVVSLQSTPTVLNSIQADANGVVTTSVVLPSSTAPGSHTLSLLGLTSGVGARKTVTIEAESRNSFVSLSEPKRLVDTRDGNRFGTTSTSGVSIKRIKITDAKTYKGETTGLPDTNIGAVALNVTAVGGNDDKGYGFVTVYPCDSPTTPVPNSSNLNFSGGQTIPNAVIAPVSANGYICFSVNGNTDLLVDAAGYFPADSGLSALTEPKRLVDTRDGNRFGTTSTSGVSIKRIKITDAKTYKGETTGLPDTNIGAVALNVTAVGGNDDKGYGFVTVYPCDSPTTRVPDSSNLNFTGGQTIPNSVIAPVSANGYICFSVNGNTDLLVDAAGYFPANSGFSALTEPKRLVDTRGGDRFGTTSTSGVSIKRIKITDAKTYKGETTGLPDTNIGAVALNVTAVGGNDDKGYGFVTVYPCDSPTTPVPNSSNLNFSGGQTIPNSVIAPVSANGYICFSVNGNTDLLVDAAGYFPANP
jgi:ELWxxDGT repeat protein